MVCAGDHTTLLDEESGVEELRPRQGLKILRVCASVVGCMALAGGGYLAGHRAASSTESLQRMIGEVGVPQTVEEAKQMYTQITKDMALADKAGANSAILSATPPTNPNLLMLNTWYTKGSAASDQTIMQHFLYDALIQDSEPSSSIRSDAFDGKTGIPNTEEQFKALYQKVTRGQTEAGIAAINVKVLGGGAGAVTGDLKLLKDWYAAGTSSNKAFAQGILMDTLDDPAVRVATPPTASSFSSYAEFGQEYSRQTAGKPWSTIVTIDASVREVSLPSSASPAVQQLHHWYQHHATAEEKHDFDTGAVEHEQMGVR